MALFINKFFILTAIFIHSLVISGLAMAEESNIPCMIQNRQVGYLQGQDQALIDSLVSKFPNEQLTPLAKPDPIRPLPVEYINPKNQKYYRQTGRSEFLQEKAAYQLMTMVRKAYENGIRLFVHSGYRSYEQQCHVFRTKVLNEIKTTQLKLDQAIISVNQRSAFPGESEHQLGTTVDLVSDDTFVNFDLNYEFAKTQAFQWLKSNAAEFGFVMSFPPSPSGDPTEPHPTTKIIYEPWHWRYVGEKISKQYQTCLNKITPQEFLRNLKTDSNYICN